MVGHPVCIKTQNYCLLPKFIMYASNRNILTGLADNFLMKLEYFDNCGRTPCMHKNMKIWRSLVGHPVCIRQEYLDSSDRPVSDKIGKS